jgi:hypothetical protein
MAEPDKFEQFRQASKFEKDITDYLGVQEKNQNKRWDLLKEVVNLAVIQYLSMRIDAVEESIKDKSASIWLSCVLTVGVTLFPVSAASSTLILALTKSTQNLLTRSARAQKESLKFLEDYSTKLGMTSSALTRSDLIAAQIKRTEETVVDFAKKFEPELTNTLQDAAHGIAQTLGTHSFTQTRARKYAQTAPAVAVSITLLSWIMTRIDAEDAKRTIIKDTARHLFDVATSPEPAKEAASLAAASLALFLGLIDALPKTNKQALDLLKKLRDDLVVLANEETYLPPIEQLEDVQIWIEMMIWVTTYDFNIIETKENANRDDSKVRQVWVTKLEHPPLPEKIWEKLISRYRDPDRGVSFKHAGNRDRLGDKDDPMGLGGSWGPEIRLSYYFSKVVFPQIDKENFEMVERMGKLPPPPPGLKQHKFK